jgi:hypothetical protein
MRSGRHISATPCTHATTFLFDVFCAPLAMMLLLPRSPGRPSTAVPS